MGKTPRRGKTPHQHISEQNLLRGSIVHSIRHQKCGQNTYTGKKSVPAIFRGEIGTRMCFEHLLCFGVPFPSNINPPYYNAAKHCSYIGKQVLSVIQLLKASLLSVLNDLSSAAHFQDNMWKIAENVIVPNLTFFWRHVTAGA